MSSCQKGTFSLIWEVLGALKGFRVGWWDGVGLSSRKGKAISEEELGMRSLKGSILYGTNCA